MSRPVVVFTDASYYAKDFAEKHLPRLASLAQLRFTTAETAEQLIEDLDDAVLLVNRRLRLPGDLFARAPGLRGVVKWGAGVDHIDIEAASAHGVVVANSPGNYIAVAEAALSLILALSKHLLIWHSAAQTGRELDSAFRGHEVFGKTLGIIGLGRIGRHLTKMARGCGMEVLAHDPYVAAGQVADLNVTLAPLPVVLEQSDFVSIHAALTTETHHLIGERALRSMKPTAYLINTARGAIIDEQALVEALRTRAIAGAGLDVFEHEPVASDHPLLHMPNVIATPHALARTWESMARTVHMLEEAAIAILEGRRPETVLSPTATAGRTPE